MLKGASPPPPETVVDEKAVADSYARGLYDGGEGLVDAALGELEVLPDLSAREIVAAGVAQLRDKMVRLWGGQEVLDALNGALDAGQPLSVVRLGDGELLTLAQDVVMAQEEVAEQGHFLGYAGVRLPDPEARNLLVHAVRHADIVGIPGQRLPNFQPLAFAAFRAHGIDYRELRMTLSTINYVLYLEGRLPELLRGRRILLIGNVAPALAEVLRGRGLAVSGAVAPVRGMDDVPRVMESIAEQDFDLALVAAGIAAVVLTQRIATELGKVAIDFGHLADALAKGEAAL
ncbi:hypothetical protein IDH44_25890 [Paenibacillus sp. IB182496]|uniref:GT-D fold-like domain-containing protein n=1 Tax=Paenibacillus sabuli TaxID=2772509 RepID=A0A927BYC4_9BACL|nr:hypothetical protein [Paenibacillus sabuli]